VPTRAHQIELLSAGVIYDGAQITTPYAKFLVAGTSTAKNAYDDSGKAVAITKKALDSQGRASVYGDGIYKIEIYSGDPDAGGTKLFEVDNYKVTAVAGDTRTVTSATVAGSVDDALVVGDTTSNSITYTLPDAALMAGKIIQIAKSVAANTLTVAAASGQLVNGAASVAYTAINSTGVFQSDGSNWYVFQTVGDADTLGGVAADTGTTADTIPVRDSDGFIPGSMVFRGALVHLAGSQTIPDSTLTAINFDTEEYDTSAFHDLATNTSRFTIPAEVSRVRLTGKINFFGDATGGRVISITKNGSQGYVGGSKQFLNNNGTDTWQAITASPVISVSEGDYFELEAQQYSGGNLDVSGGGTGSNTWFAIEVVE